MAPSFPILSLAAVTTLFLASIFLVIFYLFATKFFSHNCHHHHLYLLLRRLILLPPPLPPPPPPLSPSLDNGTADEDPFIAFSPSPWRSNNNISRGLHNIDIQHIPTLQFRHKLTMVTNDVVPYDGCVVCLNEFKEQDMLRVLPSCGHGFHLDCIDVWLQSNANCPLCRISISGKSPCENPNPVMAPSSSPQSSCRFSEMGDEDFVVIELGGHSLEEERMREGRQNKEIRISNRSSSSGKFDSKFCNVNARKQQCFRGMMGDECIEVRDKKRDDFFFSVQPIRRSFSLDSAADKQQLHATVQAIIQQNRTEKQIKLFSLRNP